MNNPYAMNALAEGLYKGYSLYLQKKGQDDAQAEREFQRGQAEKEFGLRQAADQRAAQAQTFNQGLSTRQEDRAGRALDETIATGTVTRKGLEQKQQFEAEDRPLDLKLNRAKADLAESQATKAAAEAKVAPALAGLSVTEARQKIDSDAARTEGQKITNAAGREALDVSREERQGIRAYQDVLDRTEDLKPMFDDPMVQSHVVDLYRGVMSLRNGQAPSTQITAESTASTSRMLFGRAVKNAYEGKEVTEATPNLFKAVGKGATIVSAVPDGVKVDPRTGKAFLSVDVRVKMPNGQVTTIQNIADDGSFPEFDMDEEFEKVGSLLGYKASLARDGVNTPEAYGQLRELLLRQAATKYPKHFTDGSLKAAGVDTSIPSISEATGLLNADAEGPANVILARKGLGTVEAGSGGGVAPTKGIPRRDSEWAVQ